ncbi:hypothetical protein ABZ864_10155 [Streptomyces sp. NPDC047082]|uniref:hypothetical protein n=1 Tax=Streptomyces sp. NPDC047082 TaxID=3155259 RepID=UPI0033DACB14
MGAEVDQFARLCMPGGDLVEGVQDPAVGEGRGQLGVQQFPQRVGAVCGLL